MATDGVRVSSFQKRTKTPAVNVVGTKISASNSSLYVSTGIPSLDDICDGGLPLGSLCLIEEDMYGSYAKIVSKYFLAEGTLHNNFLLTATLNESPWDILNNLPSSVAEVRETKLAETKEELKIAWRYENLSVGDSQEKTGKVFDLSIPYILPESTLKSQYCVNLLRTVDNAIKKWQLDSGSNSNLLRVVVSSFGSPYWKLDSQSSTDLTATLLLLKSLARSANVVIVVTIPHQLLDKNLVARSQKLADVVFQLKSLREDPKLQDLMDVHGILEIKKIVNLSSLKPVLGSDGTTTYGFKATKRKFKIEKLHLPPALEDETSSNNVSTAGCASNASSKNNLDF
nr:EOG090X0ALT [Scapholeberis mucronata]